MRWVIFLLSVFLLYACYAQGVSVASEFLQNDTLVVAGGESIIYSVWLQNPKDYEVSVELHYSKGIMVPLDFQEVYVLEPRTANKRVQFNITAPEKPGDYGFGFSVNEVNPSGGEGIGLRLKVGKTFTLRVVEDPDKLNINYTLIAYVVLLLFLAYYVIKRLLKGGAVSKKFVGKPLEPAVKKRKSK